MDEEFYLAMKHLLNGSAVEQSDCGEFYRVKNLTYSDTAPGFPPEFFCFTKKTWKEFKKKCHE